MKPKVNRAGSVEAGKGYDRCNTPAYALDPLLPYIRRGWAIWEPAAGTGNLVGALGSRGYAVTGSDILDGRNFFDYQPPTFDAIVTNPPYSIKFDWLARCYALGKPFALLVPVETIGAQAAQRLMERHGAELLLLNRRVNFEMPNKGWEGSSAQFPTCWLCWRMLPAPIIYGKLPGARPPSQAVMDLSIARPKGAQICAVCHTPLDQPATGRRRKYCDPCVARLGHRTPAAAARKSGAENARGVSEA